MAERPRERLHLRRLQPALDRDTESLRCVASCGKLLAFGMQYPAEGLWPHGSKSVVQVALPNAPYDMVDREQETVAVSPELGSHLRPIASGLLSAERLTLRYCYFHC